MAKDLSKWLVGSDIDGTLNNKFRQLPKRNYDAIKKFINECGGHFTLASGRGIESMRPHFENLNLTTPAVIINGAAIYDYKKEEIIYFSPIGEEGRELIKDIINKFPVCEFEIVTPEKNFFVRARVMAPFMLTGDPLPHEFVNSVDDVPFGRWAKVIMIAPPNVSKKIRKYIDAVKPQHLTFMSSSIVSFEMLAENTNKGTALLKVAEMLGVDKEHTAAIGDYFNDYEMLKSVGLPACCGQAPKGMQEIAQFHACHCNSGAVADLLEHIESISD